MAYNSCESLAIALSSIDATCDKSIGGIKRILIANKQDIVAAEVNSTTGKIDVITLAEGKKFQQWIFRRNTGSYTSTVTSDATIGNSSVTTEVSLQFSRAEAEKRLVIQSAINAGAVIIVEDSYGEYLYLGYDNEVYITNAVMQSGTAASDLSGFTLTFTDESAEFPHFVNKDDVDIDGLIA